MVCTPEDIRIEAARYRLKKWRIAARAGISPSYLSDIEAGRSPASPVLLERIGNAIEQLKTEQMAGVL